MAFRDIINNNMEIPNRPIIELDSKCSKMASVLFCILSIYLFQYFISLVNHHDVNKILFSYLTLWRDTQSDYGIPLSVFIKYFDKKYHNLIAQFFQHCIYYLFYLIANITYSKYFLFICTFMFFGSSHVLPLLLSMANIMSNLFITTDQIRNFLSLIRNTVLSFDVILLILEDSENRTEYSNNGYSIRAFMNIFINSTSYEDYVDCLKNILINLTIGNDYFEVIQKRVEFYYIKGNEYAKPPFEPLLSKLHRKLFTNHPAPYHYDYFIHNPKRSSLSEMIFTLRQDFGYSYRSNTIDSESKLLLAKSSSSVRTSCSSYSYTKKKITRAGEDNSNSNSNSIPVKLEKSSSDYRPEIRKNKIIPEESFESL